MRWPLQKLGRFLFDVLLLYKAQWRHPEVYELILNMKQTRKPTKGLSVIELYVQEEALIRVDKRCQGFLVSFFFLYITVQDSIKLLVTITDKIFNRFFFQFVIQHTMKILPDNLTSCLTLRCCKCNWVGRRWRDSTLLGVLWLISSQQLKLNQKTCCLGGNKTRFCAALHE